MGVNNTHSKTIKSAGTVFDIIEFLADRETAGVSEIARQLDFSKSTIHYYLKTLERKRYVVNENGRYRISLRLANLGATALHKHKLTGLVEDHVQELAVEAEAPSAVAVEEGGRVIFIAVSGNDMHEIECPRVGLERYLHTTAYGKAILAHLPSDDLDRIISRHGLPNQTDQTITDLDDLERDLAKVRQVGIAFASEEDTVGQSSIAAPILTDSNQVVGAFGVTGTVDRITDPGQHIKARRHAGELHELVQRSARIVGTKVVEE